MGRRNFLRLTAGASASAVTASTAGCSQQMPAGSIAPWQGRDPLQRHRAIAAEAWRIELTLPRMMRETFKVLRLQAHEIAQHRDGLVLLDRLPVLMSKLGLLDRSKAPASDDYATPGPVHRWSDADGCTAWPGRPVRAQVTAAVLWLMVIVITVIGQPGPAGAIGGSCRVQ